MDMLGRSFLKIASSSFFAPNGPKPVDLTSRRTGSAGVMFPNTVLVTGIELKSCGTNGHPASEQNVIVLPTSSAVGLSNVNLGTPLTLVILPKIVFFGESFRGAVNV